MGVEIIDIDNGFDDFFDKIETLTKMDAEVGYQQGESEEDGIDLAKLAIIHELGEGQTARPFMRDSFDNNEQEIGDMGVKLADKYLDDKIDAELALEVWGDFYRNTMMNGVVTRELGLADNEQSTIDRKGSDTPLIDSSRMINGATVKVS
jgi:hypothetical protein